MVGVVPDPSAKGPASLVRLRTKTSSESLDGMSHVTPSRVKKVFTPAREDSRSASSAGTSAAKSKRSSKPTPQSFLSSIAKNS